MTDPYGIASERRRREITAHHGVPDFVFRPRDVPKGNAQREVGDFLLWVGDVIAIVSHKAREPDALARETQARRRSWLEGRIAGAYEQIQGVHRRLLDTPVGQLELENERGVKVPWDPEDVQGYVGVVVVDGLAPDDDYGPELEPSEIPSIVMLASDWDRICQLLPSTMTIIKYIARRAQYVPRCPLGAELDVLALLLEQENLGQPITIPAGGLPKDHFLTVRAAHPDWFLGGHPDDKYAFVVDAMIEGAADPDPDFSTTADPLEYMRIVEVLDRIPLLTRVQIGRLVIERCERVGREGGRISTRLAIPGGMLVFVTDDRSRVDRTEWLRGLTPARHTQALDAGATRTFITLGVATQPIPSPDGGRAHDFLFVQGLFRLDDEFRAVRDDLFGAPDMGAIVESWRSHSSE